MIYAIIGTVKKHSPHLCVCVCVCGGGGGGFGWGWTKSIKILFFYWKFPYVNENIQIEYLIKFLHFMSGDKVLPSNATRERRLHNRQITMKGILHLLHLQSC